MIQRIIKLIIFSMPTSTLVVGNFFLFFNKLRRRYYHGFLNHQLKSWLSFFLFSFWEKKNLILRSHNIQESQSTCNNGRSLGGPTYIQVLVESKLNACFSRACANVMLGLIARTWQEHFVLINFFMMHLNLYLNCI